MIFWKGRGGLPPDIASSSLASLVVRGKLIEVVLLDFIILKTYYLGRDGEEYQIFLLRI